MLRILVIADMHGEIELVSKLLDNINPDDFDLVICPGDFTDMFNIPDGFTQIDVAEILLQKLLSFGKPVLTVPGNHDPYEMVELFDEYGVNLHEEVKKIGEFNFMGFGGAMTPFNTKFEPTEEEIKQALEKMYEKINGKFILVTHSPPFNTKLDLTETGDHVGSKVIREFIESKQPILSISAHIHESGGIDKLGKTTLFYPGVSFEGKYGIVKIDGKNVECEIKTLKI